MGIKQHANDERLPPCGITIAPPVVLSRLVHDRTCLGAEQTPRSYPFTSIWARLISLCLLLLLQAGTGVSATGSPCKVRPATQASLALGVRPGFVPGLSACFTKKARLRPQLMTASTSPLVVYGQGCAIQGGSD
jgi:hypothetical protein